MSRRIQRSIEAPIREGLSWQDRWRGEDRGLILNWEVGRKIARKDPDLAAAAKRGELPPSHWKGGVEKKLKTVTHKYGPLSYLAEWQGIRGDDLDVSLDEEVELKCSRTGMTVTYTSDVNRYKGG